MEGGDVDTYSACDVARAEAFEARAGQPLVGGVDQLLALPVRAGGGRWNHFINQLINNA